MELLPEAVTPKVEGMDDHGWSNSPAAAHAPDDVHPEVAELEVQSPGFSNAKAVTADDTETKVVEESQAEDKSVKSPAKKATAKRTTAKKTAAKKG